MFVNTRIEASATHRGSYSLIVFRDQYERTNVCRAVSRDPDCWSGAPVASEIWEQLRFLIFGNYCEVPKSFHPISRRTGVSPPGRLLWSNRFLAILPIYGIRESPASHRVSTALQSQTDSWQNCREAVWSDPITPGIVVRKRGHPKMWKLILILTDLGFHNVVLDQQSDPLTRQLAA